MKTPRFHCPELQRAVDALALALVRGGTPRRRAPRPRPLWQRAKRVVSLLGRHGITQEQIELAAGCLVRDLTEGDVAKLRALYERLSGREG